METVWNKLTSMCSGSSEGNTDSLMSFFLPKNCSFFLVVLGLLFGFVTVGGFFPSAVFGQQVNGYCKNMSGKWRTGKVSSALALQPGQRKHNLWHLLQKGGM